MDRKELEERLEEFRDRQLRVFTAFRSNMLKEFDEKSNTPAEEARERRLASPEYHTSNTHLDVVWGFREGVRWFKTRLMEDTCVSWGTVAGDLIKRIEREGTA